MKKLSTPGDKLRARTEMGYSPQQVLASWKDGAVLGRGDAAADDKGSAVLKLPASRKTSSARCEKACG